MMMKDNKTIPLNTRSLLTSIIESPKDIIIFSLDRNYNYTVFNSNHKGEMKRIWGVDIEVGMNLLEIIPNPEDRDKARRNFDSALQGEPLTVVEEYGSPAQRFWYENIYNPVLDENGNVIGVSVFLTDITSRKQAEEDLKSQHVKLQKAKQEADAANESKSQFLANMSHEIRTPMTAILGFSEILSTKITDKEQKRYLENIHYSGESLLALINDILDLSKVEAGKMDIHPETLGIRDFLEDIQRMFSNQFRSKGLRFQLSVSPSIPVALVLDKIRVRQVLVNLVGNALKFSSRGYVKLSVTRPGDKRKQHPKPRVGERIHMIIEVKDTGIGIPSDQQELIFENFRQKDGQRTKKYGGTGLGLPISRRLVEMMEGKLTVKSKPGHGSTFRVELPGVKVGRVQDISDGDAPSNELQVQFRTSTILVVDDSSPARDLVEAYLGNTPVTVMEAKDSEEALALLENLQSPETETGADLPHLIIMDMKMPGKSGYQLTKFIKNHPRFKHIPVIISTASVMKEDEDRLKDTADGFLRKPYKKVELIRQLIEYLPHTIFQSPVMPGSMPDETKEKDAAGEFVFDIPLPPRIIPRMPQLIQTLKNSVQPHWEEISETLIFDEIKSFILPVETLGEQYHCPPLVEWSRAVVRCLESFDMEALPRTFRQFEHIMTKLEHFNNGG
ncbi:MAG: response regulator [bacterium]|nr:response regulator [bacterium]